jgi:hypothetical protein
MAFGGVRVVAELQIGPGYGREIQVKAARPRAITKLVREIFLIELAATCNVRLAASRAERHSTAFYALRTRDSDFAEEWRAAIEAGYDRLEAALLRRALAVVEGDDASDPVTGEPDATAANVHKALARREPLGEMTVAQALDVMTRLRPLVAAKRASGRRGVTKGVPTPEETNAEIMRRIRILRHQSSERAAPAAAATLVR